MPSESGIRYYVNRLLEQTSHQSQNKIQRLNQLLIENHYDSSTALTNFAHELSMKSQYATLVVRPNHKQDVINDIHLIRANNHLIILVMVFSSGHVENIHFVSHAQLNNINLNKIANFLTEHFSFNRKVLTQNIESYFSQKEELLLANEVVEMINLQIGNQSNSIYMGGKVKLIDALNESNVSSIQPILQYIESNKITELLEDISTSQINVRIGKEIDDSLSDISIVTSQYHFDESLKVKLQ